MGLQHKGCARPAWAALFVCVVAVGCDHPSAPVKPPAETTTVNGPTTVSSAPRPGSDRSPTASPSATTVSTELQPGLTVQYVPASIPSPAGSGDGLITLVRIDPSRFRFRLLTAASHGPRTAPDWSHIFGLTGVINASMFREDLRSTGYMIDGDVINNGWIQPAFGAFLAFDPRREGIPAAALVGRDCPGFDFARLRQEYRVVIQNYRMFDCDGSPLAWNDSKLYSIAAIAADRDGRIVFIHSRTPHRMRDFNRMLAAPELELTSAMFVEGGPAASLYVKTESGTIENSGSWDGGFFQAQGEQRFQSIPNVIGFAPLED